MKNRGKANNQLLGSVGKKNSRMKFYRLHRPEPIVYGNKRVYVVGEKKITCCRTGGLEIASMRRDVLADHRGKW